MKQEWTDKLRERMADYEQPPGDDVWTAIEQRLGSGKVKKRPLWRRIAVAAAVMLVAAGVALETMTDPATTPQTESALTAEVSPTKNESTDKQTNTTHYIYKGKDGEKVATQKQTIAEADPPTPPTEEKSSSVETTDRGNGSSQPTPPTDPNILMQNIENSESATKPTIVEPSHHAHRNRPSSSKADRLTATITFSAFTTGNAAWQSPVFMSAARAMMFGDGGLPDSPIRLTNYHEETNHHRPLTIGITLRYPLSQRWYIESGLGYSRLTSDFTKVLPSYEIKETQRVQYLGVPLRLRHRLWQWHSFALSASAGAQADFCIAIKRKNGGVVLGSNRDRPQFSVSASMAAEYLLGSHMALYLEPTLKYYIDNQSNVQTIFKEQPTQLNLHLGACYTF